MTNDNDLIRRGDAIRMVNLYVKASRHVTLADQTIEAIAAIPARSYDDVDLLFDAYKAILVLHKSLDTYGLTLGAQVARELADRIVKAHPEFPPRTALRAAVAASQPADPAVNADSRQRVTVDGLATLMFNEWKRVDPRSKVAMFPVSYMSTFADMARAALAAIDVQPDPRDAQIAALVEAAEAAMVWDAARGYPLPYRVRDTIVKALAAVKGGDA